MPRLVVECRPAMYDNRWPCSDADALFRENKQMWLMKALCCGDIAQYLFKKGLGVINNTKGRLFLKASVIASAS